MHFYKPGNRSTDGDSYWERLRSTFLLFAFLQKDEGQTKDERRGTLLFDISNYQKPKARPVGRMLTEPIEKTGIRRGEIYLADLDPIKGSEQGGIRPVLVVQNAMEFRYSPTVVIAPITSRVKRPLLTHIAIINEALFSESTILVEQIRTIDKSRLKKLLGYADQDILDRVDQAIRICIES